MLDQLWKDHLLTLDHLRQGIGLRAYAQRDPLNEYKQEAFNLFEEMLNNLRERVTQVLCNIELQVGDQDEQLFSHGEQKMYEGRNDPAFSQDDNDDRVIPRLPTTGRKASANVDPNDQSTWGRISRNTECPCKSGKKYKHCHGTV